MPATRSRSILFRCGAATLSLLALLVTGCGTLGSGRTQGKIEKDIYHSPHGNYSLPIPIEPGLGRSIQDEADVSGKGGYLSICNDFGVLCSVEYGEITPEARAILEGADLPELLRKFHEHTVVTKAQEFPGLRSLHDEAVPGVPGPAHFFVLFIPGGSTLARPTALGMPGDRFNTVRAFLAFVQDGFIYSLGYTGKRDAMEPDLVLTPERVEDYKRVLGELRASMRFTPVP